MENGVNLDERINDTIKNRKTKRFVLIVCFSLLAIVCVLVAFFFIRYSYRKLNTISFDEYKVYQYFSGVKYEYDGKATIENGELVNISSEGKKVDLGDTPIYFQNLDNVVLFPENMGLFFPEIKNKNYRINRLSKIEIEKDNENEELAYVVFNDENEYIQLSFLYNGSDMYFFPYSVSLEVDGKKYELSPLSYVIANYKDSVEIYNREYDNYVIIEETENDVIATLKGYKINLSTDMIMYEDGDRLLIKSVSKLPKYGK